MFLEGLWTLFFINKTIKNLKKKMSRLTGNEVQDLMEAYNTVYAPQELTEEQIWEEVENWVNSLLEEGYDLSEYTWEDLYENYITEIAVPPRNPASARAQSASASRTLSNIGTGIRNILNPGRVVGQGIVQATRDYRAGGPRDVKGRPIKPAAPILPPPRPAATTPASRPPAPILPPPQSPSSSPRPAATTAAPKPATPPKPANSSPANLSSADKIKSGMGVYNAQKKAGDFKGASATGSEIWKTQYKDTLAKPKTDAQKFNPLMNKTFNYQTGNAPDQQQVRANNIINSGKVAALKPKAPTTPIQNTSNINKARGSSKPGSVMSSYEWPSSKTIKDLANAYSSIYEAKKVDQDADGDNDFADVRIARMIASGVPKEVAIQKVKGKPYNEEVEIDEAAKRVSKKVRGAKDPIAYMSGRSDAGKRISGDEKTGPRHYTLGRARGAEVDAPTTPGAKPKNTPKASKSELQYARTAHKSKSGKDWNKVGGRKGLPGSQNEEYEIYEIIASYLLENNIAETLDNANIIIENMSTTWMMSILEALPFPPPPIHPPPPIVAPAPPSKSPPAGISMPKAKKSTGVTGSGRGRPMGGPYNDEGDGSGPPMGGPYNDEPKYKAKK